MAVSHYFSNFSPATTNEQRLLEDLIVESIKISGHDVWYIPRSMYDSVDQIYGEIVNSKFTAAYKIDMFVANVQGYEGDGEFFGKFGLELRETSNFVIARRTFEKYVPSSIITRPREGDLIFVPLMHKVFEIKFVEEELMFFSLGKRNPYIYELRCEVFRYSHETIDTGVDEIDIIEDNASYTIQLFVGDNTGNFYDGETVYQGANLTYATASAKVKEFDYANNSLDLINVVGTFRTNVTITGVTSTYTANVTTEDTLGDYTRTSDIENKSFEDIADTLLITDNNPFGAP